MTDVAPPSKTAEINDAVFCLAHFKEVVRHVPHTPGPLLFQALRVHHRSYIPLTPLTWMLILFFHRCVRLLCVTVQ